MTERSRERRATNSAREKLKQDQETGIARNARADHMQERVLSIMWHGKASEGVQDGASSMV